MEGSSRHNGCVGDGERVEARVTAGVALPVGARVFDALLILVAELGTKPIVRVSDALLVPVRVSDELLVPVRVSDELLVPVAELDAELDELLVGERVSDALLVPVRVSDADALLVPAVDADVLVLELVAMTVLLAVRDTVSDAV